MGGPVHLQANLHIFTSDRPSRTWKTLISEILARVTRRSVLSQQTLAVQRSMKSTWQAGLATLLSSTHLKVLDLCEAKCHDHRDHYEGDDPSNGTTDCAWYLDRSAISNSLS